MSIPQAQPKCCGEVVDVVLSPSVRYWYCRGCKKEPNVAKAQSAPNGRKSGALNLDDDDLLVQFEALLKAKEEEDEHDKLVTLIQGRPYAKCNTDPFKIATRKDVEEDPELRKLTTTFNHTVNAIDYLTSGAILTRESIEAAREHLRDSANYWDVRLPRLR